MVRLSRALCLGALLALTCLAGCATAPRLTELVVVVELGAGLEVPRDLAWLEIRADTRAGRVLRETVPFTGPAAQSFPLTLGIVHPEDRDSSIDIVVNGFSLGDVTTISRRVATRFVPGERRVVHIVLERACYLAACEGGLTCRGGACVDPVVDPATLPPYSGALPDAGAAPPDAGLDGHVPLDASLDATLDGGASDAGPALDAPPDARLDAASCEGDAGLAGEPMGCTLARPPARLTCGDGGDDGLTRNFALLDPLLDQSRGAWARVGIDLDGMCSNPLLPGTPSECDTPLGDPPLDGDGGRDNVIGQLVYGSILAFFPDYQTETRTAARNGRSAPIIRLSGWNGLDDDARVRVVFATAIDVIPAGTPLPPGGLTLPNALPPPAWDGTDTAYVGANYFAAGMESRPLVVDDNAYITGRTLVVTIPPRAPVDFPVPRGVGRVRLTDARLLATLAPDGASLLDAVIVGRWGYVDILSHLADLGVCSGTPETDMFLAAFDILMRRSMDVRGVPGTGGAGVDCDAASVSLPFETGVPVLWGGVQPLELVPGTCP